MMREDFEPSRGIEEYVKTFQTRCALDVSFQKSGSPIKLSPDGQLTLFRVLQESLSNVVKHANARRVSVQLDVRSSAGQPQCSRRWQGV